tara:strand:- start:692 stop:1243 length:552 start_codon:yes stop_codon:yes gene_type:complete
MEQKYTDFDKLNRLLVTSFGAEKFYYNAAQDAHKSELKRFFNYMAVERNKMSHSISNELRSRGIEPLKNDIEKGNVERDWHQIKEALENFDAISMINQCIAKDKFNIRKINEMLETKALPQEVLTLLETQRTQLDWYIKQAEQHKINPFKKEAATRDEFFRENNSEKHSTTKDPIKIIDIKAG